MTERSLVCLGMIGFGLWMAGGCSADPPAGTGSRIMQSSPMGPSPARPLVPPAAGTGGAGSAGTAAPPPSMDGGAADAAASMPDGMVDVPLIPLCEDDDGGVGADAASADCVAVGDLHAQYRAADAIANDNAIKPHFKLVNHGAEAVPLTELTLRYWYTRDALTPEVFWCDYAQIGCGSVQGVFVVTQRAGADRYMEQSFTSGTLGAGADTGEIQTRFNHDDWALYDESDDHSFEPAQTAFADTPKVTVYRRGRLVWGQEPSP